MNDMFRSPAKKELRPHQVATIAMLRQSLARGNRRVVVQGPTGFGKTLVAAKIIEGARAKGNRVIFTAPAISLIDQTVAAFEAEGLDGIGVMQADHPRTDPSAPLQVASVQTLARRAIPQAALVLVDEAHIRSKAIDSLMDERPDVFFVGLSATPWAKGMGLRWQDLVIPCTIGELIEGGYLSRFEAYAPDVPDLRGVKVTAGEYAESALEAVMGEAKIVASIVQTWLARGENRPTLAFCASCAHARQVQQEFIAAGINAAYVDAYTDMVERRMIERQFRLGDVKVACSVRTLTTGVDWPVSCVIDAAPTMSEMLHVQKIGRGLRVNPGTEDLIILDHAGNSLRLGLVTDIHHDTLDATPPAEKQKRAVNEKLPKECANCGALNSGLVCPYCGHEKKPPHIEEGEGELVAIGKVKVPTMADKQRFWSMARWLDADRKRGGKLALGLYKSKFGVWPRGLRDEVLFPDQDFWNYEKSRRISYAKKKQAETK